MKLWYVITAALIVSASAYFMVDSQELYRFFERQNQTVDDKRNDDVHKNEIEKKHQESNIQSGSSKKTAVYHAVFTIPTPLITAVKTVDKSTASPGELLTYTIVISNNGDETATGLSFSDNIDVNTTLVTGSVKTAPIAANDQYTSLGNVGITVPAVNGILANDYLGVNPAAVFTAVTDAATTQGGTISIAADGGFTYTPPVGFTGNDTYNYALTNTAGTDNGTITITIDNLTWFINNNYTGTVADGRLNTPFKSLNDFQAVNDGAASHPANNHTIFIYESSTNYNGNISLRAGQKLVGQDATTSLQAIAGYSLPVYSMPLPVLNNGNATKVILTGTANNTPVINLTGGAAATHTIRGLTISDKPNDAATAGISGTSFGTLNLSETSVSGTGQALVLSTGTVNASFDNLSSSSGGSGISLTTVNGSLTAANGSLLDNATGIKINGGTASLTYNGTVSNSSTLLVDIQNKTGGTVDLNGAVSSGAGARGINLANNTGAIIRFDGGLSLTTGTQPAFSATGGGTLHVTQDNTLIVNTIVTTSGIALQVSATTIGANGVTFRSIAVNGASKGIILNSTGAGAFTITGQGSTAGSGGLIQNTSARGIELSTVQNISLNNIQLTNANTTDAGGAGICDELNNIGCNAALYIKDATTVALNQVNITTTAEQGMNMNNVSGLTMNNCTVQGNGDASEEGALKLRNILGTSTISNSLFKNSAFRIAHIINNTGTAHLTVSNSSFINDASNTSLIKQDCFEMRTQNAASATLLINNSIFKRAGTKGIQVFAENTSTINMAITGSSVDREGQLMAGIEVGSDQTATMNANVDGNVLISGDREVPLNIYSGATSTMQATARNNTNVQGGNNPNLNPFATLRGYADQNSNSKVLFTNNVVTNTDQEGILVAAAGGTTGGSISGQVGNNTVNTNNTAGNLTTNAIALRSFSGGAGANSNCSYVNNNAVTVVTGTRHFRVTAASATSVVQLQGPASANLEAIWNANGNFPTTPTAEVSVATVAGATVTYGGAFTCPTPTNTTIPASIVIATPIEESNTLVSESGFKAKYELPDMDMRFDNDSATNKQLPSTVVNDPEPSIELLSGENVTISGISLPANKSLKIVFQVTVNDPFPDGVCKVSNQATVSGSNFSNVLTDNDANSGNGINPTETIIPVAPSITSCQNNINVATIGGACTSSQAFSVTASGCPAPTITYTINGTATVITSPHNFPIGTTTVLATASNGVGSNATCEFTVTITDAAPAVTSVSVPANGNYKLSEALNFTVNFSQAVTVNTAGGTPTLPLTIGAASRNASYTSGSGTSALVFSYVVSNTDLDVNGIAVGASIALNGATIRNSCNTNASLTLNAVGNTSAVLVDGIVPTVTINQAAGQADPTSNTTINFTAIFSEPVSGFTNTDVSIGGTALATTAVITESAPMNGTTFTIAISGMANDGTVIPTIGANKVTDAAGNNNTASTSTDNSVTFVADAAPFAVSINRFDPAAAKTNADAVTFRATFSEAVTGVGVSDFTIVTSGTATGSVNAVSPVGSDGIIYDIQINNVAGDGTLRLNLNSNGTGIKDNIGQDITGGLTGQTYTIDNTAPVISGCPDDLSVPVGSNCKANPSWTEPTATDAVDGSISFDYRSLAPGDELGVGEYTVIYKFKDAAGNESQCSFKVTVADNQQPVVSNLQVNPSVLWPPDHKMKDVHLTYQVQDNCGCTPSIVITSNEPEHGTGDGDKKPDYEILTSTITSTGATVRLRAERGNGRDARVYTIKVLCTDQGGNIDEAQTEVRIAHNITGPVSGASFKIGSTVNFSGVFWDKPGNKHTGQWLIDGSAVKGTLTEPAGTKNGKLTGSYKFSNAGVYRLQMNITDQDKITSYANTNDDLEAIVVIYDPNGGYTYGGGWFNSPKGAYTNDPEAIGKVSYGYTVTYFKGATYPKGETQLEFKIGDFEFNALNFEYLAIDNARAQFKGTGKITGGQSGINFIMTVIDGNLDGSGVDKVRIKVYNKNTGEVYYDNEPGISDAANPSTRVEANSTIVISGNSPKQNRAEVITEIITEPTPLNVKVYPNPSQADFTIQPLTGNMTDRITIQVFDLYGKMLELKNVNPGELLRIGEAYRPGSYFIKVIQGSYQKQIKLIKVTD